MRHNLSDALALGLAAYAVWAKQRPAAGKHTDGYYRVATLTALFNVVTLVVIALWTGFEAIGRFRHPEPVGGSLMIWVATISVLMNTVIALALSNDAKKSLNSRAAFIHMAGDALSSLAVVIAGVIVHYTGWPYADPFVYVFIALFILGSAVGIVRETTDILMEKSPKDLDLEAVANGIKSVEPVCGLHDLHIWIVSGNPAATAHLRPGEVVVDLGSGGGLDVFLAWKIVGSTERAIGTDMTPSMIENLSTEAAALAATI